MDLPPDDDPDMVDPDDPESTPGKFSWDEELQRTVLTLLMRDKLFTLQAKDLIKPTYFSSRAHQATCSVVFEFFDKYSVLPEPVLLLEELRQKLSKDKSVLTHLAEIRHLIDFHRPSTESREYLVDKVAFFAKQQSIKEAFGKCLKLIQAAPEADDTWRSITTTLQDALNTDRNFDPGLSYLPTVRDRYDELAEQESQTEYFTTGVEGLDCEVKGGGYVRGEVLGVVAGSGVGKCFRPGTLIRMYDGSLKRVEDVRVGDLVMGDDSTPRKVLRLVSGVDDMYTVVPDKGDSYTVNSAHVLSLKPARKSFDTKSRCVAPRYRSHPRRSGDGVFDIPLNEYLASSARFRKSMKGYRVGVRYEARPVPVDPYFLGVWLGNGALGESEVTTEDPEILEALRDFADALPAIEVVAAAEENGVFRFRLRNEDGDLSRTNRCQDVLREAGVLERKHVPQAYCVNSRSVRLQLLAGLIDTDGRLVRNCFEFVQENEQIAAKVVEIARSLGMAAYYGEDRVVEGTHYKRVLLSGEIDMIPVRVARKKPSPRRHRKDPLVTGIEVAPAGKGSYYGFETDGNHRFLLEDFTVVHNSIWMMCTAGQALRMGYKVLYISLELSQERVAERFDSILTGLPIRCLVDVKDDVFAKLDALSVERKLDENPLIIKQFPAATADVTTIRAYLAQLRFHGFTPDVVVADYVGEMRDLPDMKPYESRERLVKEFRGLATEEQFFGITAFQPNRGADQVQEDNGVIQSQHLADSFGQIRPLDGCVSLNMNKLERASGCGRMWVMKQRNGRAEYMLYLKFDPDNLRISEISHDTYKQMTTTRKDELALGAAAETGTGPIRAVASPEAAAAEAASIANNFKMPEGME